GADHSGWPADFAPTGQAKRATVDRHAGVLASLLQLGARFQSRALLGRLGLAGVDGFDDVRFAIAFAGAFRNRFVQTARAGVRTGGRVLSVFDQRSQQPLVGNARESISDGGGTS